jgi:hypothetical protein
MSCCPGSQCWWINRRLRIHVSETAQGRINGDWHLDVSRLTCHLRPKEEVFQRMSSGMWYSVALVRTNILEEHATSIIRVEIISTLRTMLAITRNWSMLQRNTNYMRKHASVTSYHWCCSWIADYFHPDDESNMFLWNVTSYKIHIVSHPRRWHSSESWMWKPRILHGKCSIHKPEGIQ